MNPFVIMISGANRGIGLSIAKHLFEEKQYCLSLGIRNTAEFDVKAHFGETDRVSVSHYDALNPETAATWSQETLDRFGQIDGLINNAGILETCGIDDFNEENFDTMWLVNTKAPIILTERVWAHLKKSGRSRIINIVSVAGKTTRSDEFGYNVTKHALLAFHHSIRQTGWEHGIRATAICPGWVNTDMASSSGICNITPENRTQPSDVAKLIKTAIEMPNNASIADITVNAQCGMLF